MLTIHRLDLSDARILIEGAAAKAGTTLRVVQQRTLDEYHRQGDEHAQSLVRLRVVRSLPEDSLPECDGALRLVVLFCESTQ